MKRPICLPTHVTWKKEGKNWSATTRFVFEIQVEPDVNTCDIQRVSRKCSWGYSSLDVRATVFLPSNPERIPVRLKPNKRSVPIFAGHRFKTIAPDNAWGGKNARESFQDTLQGREYSRSILPLSSLHVSRQSYTAYFFFFNWRPRCKNSTYWNLTQFHYSIPMSVLNCISIII